MKTTNEMLYGALINRNGTDALALEEMGYEVSETEHGGYIVNGCRYIGDGDMRVDTDRFISKRSRQDYKAVDFVNLLASERVPVCRYMLKRRHGWSDAISKDDQINAMRQFHLCCVYEKQFVEEEEKRIEQYEQNIQDEIARAKRNIEEANNRLAMGKKVLDDVKSRERAKYEEAKAAIPAIWGGQ